MLELAVDPPGHRRVEDRHEHRNVVVDVAHHQGRPQDDGVLAGYDDHAIDAAAVERVLDLPLLGRLHAIDLGAVGVERLTRLLREVPAADQQDGRHAAPPTLAAGMRRAIVAIALVALAGCGGSAPSSAVPADATIYVGLDASEAERLLRGTSRADIDFERDVKPWLGERAAYFAVGPADTYGLVFDTEDEEAAAAFGRKVTSAGPQRASAVIDGRLVLASTRELLRAANAAADSGSLGDSTELADTRRYRDAERRLGGAPTLLVMRDSGYLAARREGETLRIVDVYL